MTVLDYLYDLSNLVQAFANWLSTFAPGWVVYWVVGLIAVATTLLFAVNNTLAMNYIERKVIAHFQVRYGPNRAGPYGLLQPVADAVKILLKEPIIPAVADRPVFLLAPIAAFVPAIMPWAVIPFTPQMMVADLNVGVLYVFAMGSLATIPIFMAGWSSRNKFALLGAMRAVAQMVSYEVPLVLSIVGVVISAGTLSLRGIVEAQAVPYVIPQFLGFLVFFVAGLGELNRSPLDILEAESEIVAGYHTEYSGFMFILYYIAEYTHLWAYSAFITTFFLAGWRGPLLPPYVWFVLKMLFVAFLLIWLRATMPRLRIDQLLSLAWKFLLPVALVNVFVTAVGVFIFG